MLNEELCASGAGVEREDRVGLDIPCSGELRGEVELARPLGKFLPGNLSAELAAAAVGDQYVRRPCHL